MLKVWIRKMAWMFCTFCVIDSRVQYSVSLLLRPGPGSMVWCDSAHSQLRGYTQPNNQRVSSTSICCCVLSVLVQLFPHLSITLSGIESHPADTLLLRSSLDEMDCSRAVKYLLWHHKVKHTTQALPRRPWACSGTVMLSLRKTDTHTKPSQLNQPGCRAASHLMCECVCNIATVETSLWTVWVRPPGTYKSEQD